MAIPRIHAAAKPQLIPTNDAFRTFAAPPAALQEEIVPNDLFYVRNHWREVPRIDIATYHLVVDGEVDRSLSLTYDDLKQMPRKVFQATFECCGNSPVPEYYGQTDSSTVDRINGHGIMGNAEWAGVSLADILARAGVKDSAVEVMFEGADHGPDEIAEDPLEGHLRAKPSYRQSYSS